MHDDGNGICVHESFRRIEREKSLNFCYANAVRLKRSLFFCALRSLDFTELGSDHIPNEVFIQRSIFSHFNGSLYCGQFFALTIFSSPDLSAQFQRFLAQRIMLNQQIWFIYQQMTSTVRRQKKSDSFLKVTPLTNCNMELEFFY